MTQNSEYTTGITMKGQIFGPGKQAHNKVRFSIGSHGLAGVTKKRKLTLTKKGE
jgi:hypothetical protein